jgi:hypothetical protein
MATRASASCRCRRPSRHGRPTPRGRLAGVDPYPGGPRHRGQVLRGRPAIRRTTAQASLRRLRRTYAPYDWANYIARTMQARTPVLRAQGQGLLLWVGSTSTRGGTPPYLVRTSPPWTPSPSVTPPKLPGSVSNRPSSSPAHSPTAPTTSPTTAVPPTPPQSPRTKSVTPTSSNRSATASLNGHLKTPTSRMSPPRSSTSSTPPKARPLPGPRRPRR